MRAEGALAPRVHRRFAAGALLLLGLAAGCGKGTQPPFAPAPSPASQIVAVFPVARSTGIDYETGIWVRFSEPLDPASVNERTVFLKLDTVRIPVELTYDGLSRTIHLKTLRRLELVRTYPVEITRGVLTAAGPPLAEAFFWQFRTNSLRHLTEQTPASGTSRESPYALMQWTRTEPSAGTIIYEVYVGDDSTLVAARSAPPARIVAAPYYLPPRSWGLARRVYWAITATNQTTTERLVGPVWRFETLPAGLPVDSLSVSPDHSGWINIPQNRSGCNGSMASGPSYNDGIHWPLREQAGGLKLAGARLVITTSNINLSVIRPSIRPIPNPWTPCVFSFNSPQVVYLDLAAGFQIGTAGRFALESESFAAHVEAAARYGVIYGFSIGSAVDASWNNRPAMTLYYYRVPPAPAAPKP